MILKTFLKHFHQSMRDVDAEKGFILNKGAQVITLIFVVDYPEKVRYIF